jgi:hypothetical protein
MDTANRLWFKIPQLPKAHYEVDVPWGLLEANLLSLAETGESFDRAQPTGLVLDPEYQRAHVWTREQQVAYVEYVLAGGEVGKNITWNSPDWLRSFRAPTELVDGKQRLEAVRAFLRGDFPAYGMTAKPGDRFDLGCRFKFRVCSLTTREEVLQLYLNINAGGTPHTTEELDRVRAMLAAERGKA